MGLGLAICRAIVTAHGGSIQAAPRSGGGTVVRFTLPRRDPPAVEPDAERETTAAQGSSGAPTSQLSPETVASDSGAAQPLPPGADGVTEHTPGESSPSSSALRPGETV